MNRKRVREVQPYRVYQKRYGGLQISLDAFFNDVLRVYGRIIRQHLEPIELEFGDLFTFGQRLEYYKKISRIVLKRRSISHELREDLEDFEDFFDFWAMVGFCLYKLIVLALSYISMNVFISYFIENS